MNYHPLELEQNVAVANELYPHFSAPIGITFKHSSKWTKHFYGHDCNHTGRAYINIINGLVQLQMMITEDPFSHIETLLSKGFSDDLILLVLEAAYNAD